MCFCKEALHLPESSGDARGVQEQSHRNLVGDQKFDHRKGCSPTVVISKIITSGTKDIPPQ